MLHSDVTEEIIRAFLDVHEDLRPGYLETVYAAALVVLFEERSIPFARHPALKVYFHGRVVGDFHPDLVVRDLVICELKAVPSIQSKHEAQLLNYLRASDKEVGLLLNFGPTPTFKRLIYDNARKPFRVGPRSGPPCESAADFEGR